MRTTDGIPIRSSHQLPAHSVGTGSTTAAAARFDSPEAIRAALLPEQTDEFDAAYDAALTSARRTLRLDELRGVLRTWRRVALLTDRDPTRQRRLLVALAEVRHTGRPRPGSVPWSTLRKDLGL